MLIIANMEEYLIFDFLILSIVVKGGEGGLSLSGGEQEGCDQRPEIWGKAILQPSIVWGWC